MASEQFDNAASEQEDAQASDSTARTAPASQEGAIASDSTARTAAASVIPETTLKRTGTNTFTGLLLAKGEPQGWGKQTLLMRFVEASGASTVFIATGDARLSFSKCELDKTYTVDVQGRCVQMCNGSSKYGVHSRFEVHMQYAPKNLRLATEAVRMSPSYDFTSWADLNAVSLESVVNLIGKVTSEPLRRDASGLPKAVFTLASGDFIQKVTSLGIHTAETNHRVGDTSVLAGLLMQEMEGRAHS